MSGAYETHGKRTFDVLCAGAGLIFLSPLIALVSVAVKVTSPGPALYRQTRMGAEGETFTLLKFRSMPAGTPVVSSADAADLQPTLVGRLIRRTNIDELPQLINIARGEMSTVGPRPALPTQHDLLLHRTVRGANRLRPGLTGLAQVNSYDGMSPTDKARWDEVYARQVTAINDLKIIVSTFFYLFKPPPKY